jgi:hypothetical protein
MHFQKLLLALLAANFLNLAESKPAPDDIEDLLGAINGADLQKSANEFIDSQFKALNSFSSLISEMRKAGAGANRVASSLRNVLNQEESLFKFGSPLFGAAESSSPLRALKRNRDATESVEAE